MSNQTEKKRSKTGEKFATRYGVEASQIYKSDPGPEKLRIPPKGHALYDESAPTTFDELRVEEIDRTGTMTDPIEVWTDPDSNMMWVVDGRGRLLDVREVNKRRAKEGRELVQPLIVPFKGDEKEAVARIRIKNYYRRAPTPSAMALDIRDLRAAGWSWEDCAKKLHQTVEHPEPWARRLLPLAFCVAEVRAAIDEGKLTRGEAVKFGGKAVDGSEALGKKEQLELLAEKLGEKSKGTKKSDKQVTPKQREKIAHALSNGATKKLCHEDASVAKGIVAALAFVNGNVKALNNWPDIAEIVRDALSKKKEKNEGVEE